MSMIYALVSRGKETVLTSFTPFSGNYQNIALDVLKKTDMNKTFGQFATAQYTFYTFTKEGFIFLVMVQSDYQTRIAISFLKQIQEQFFLKYDFSKRNGAVSHGLKDFNVVLKQKIQLFNDPAKVDKLSSLKKELTQLQEISLRNMDKVINRGQKIQILVKKSETQTELSLDMNNTARKVKNRMWWKNKKIMVGIILLVLVLIFLLVCLICGFTFSKC